jgi:hypothetical protein
MWVQILPRVYFCHCPIIFRIRKALDTILDLALCTVACFRSREVFGVPALLFLVLGYIIWQAIPRELVKTGSHRLYISTTSLRLFLLLSARRFLSRRTWNMRYYPRSTQRRRYHEYSGGFERYLRVTWESDSSGLWTLYLLYSFWLHCYRLLFPGWVIDALGYCDLSAGSWTSSNTVSGIRTRWSITLPRLLSAIFVDQKI